MAASMALDLAVMMVNQTVVNLAVRVAVEKAASRVDMLAAELAGMSAA